MLENIALFKGMNQSMEWLGSRQRIIAQNIANANTPGYQARDLQSADFSKTLGRFTDKQSLVSGSEKITMTTTSADHMDKPMSVGQKDNGVKSRDVYEISPDSNGVELEEQMIKSSETAMQYQMVTNLYSKTMSIMKLAVSSK